MENRRVRARTLPDGWNPEAEAPEPERARPALYHRPAGRRQRLGLLLAGLASALLPGVARSDPAPLEARNLAPQHLFLLEPGPERPAVLPSGTARFGLDLSYASIFVREPRGSVDALLDMEVARADLRYARGLGRFEVGVDLPFLWRGAGSFDAVVDEFHAITGLPGGGRSLAPRNRLAYRVESRGRVFAPEAAGAGLGDATVELKAGPIAPSRLAARALVKLPTGSRSRAFGSGHADASVGVLGEAPAGPFRFWGNLDAVYVGGTPDPTLRLGSHWALSAGGTASVDLDWLGELQVEAHYFSSPYDTGLHTLDRDSVLLAVGLARTFGTLRVSLGFTEDVAPETAQDFGVFLNLAWSGGGTRAPAVRPSR